METIFNKLDKLKMCYSVLVGTTYFKTSKNYSVKDYCVVGAKKDAKKLRPIGFRSRSNHLSHELVVEYDMNQEDIQEFKERQSDNQFVKVLHTNDGKVFEVAGNSLKTHIDEM